MKIKTTRHKLLLTTTICVAAVSLASCASMPKTPEEAHQMRSEKIAEIIRRAENKAGLSRSLKTLEKRYKSNSENEIAATEYAYALRKEGMLTRAQTILEPFAKSKDTSAPTKTEYAKVLLEQGKTKESESYAQQAVLADDKYDRAYHVLGVALDAQGMHEEAERAFRKGLELWEGDPTTIMNNLALNLASQNQLEEASEILYKAQALSPERVEIERNIRIINALKQSQGIPVPKPRSKPSIKE